MNLHYFLHFLRVKSLINPDERTPKTQTTFYKHLLGKIFNNRKQSNTIQIIWKLIQSEITFIVHRIPSSAFYSSSSIVQNKIDIGVSLNFLKRHPH